MANIAQSKNDDKIQNENSVLSSRHILFELEKEYLAIPLKFVQEVLEITKIRKIPRISNKFYGVINLRGNIIPVINFLNCLYKIEDKTKIEITGMKTIILRIGQETFGIAVHKIHDILEFKEEYYENVPTVVQTKISKNYIDNILNINGNIVILLSIKKIIADELLLKIEAQEEEPLTQIEKTREKKKHVVQSEDNLKSGSSLELNKDQLDAMKEIVNIATGKASIAMSKVFKNKTQIGISIDQVLIKDLKNFEESSPFNIHSKVVGIRATIKDDMNASIFMILPLDQIPILLKNMEGVENPPLTVSSEDELDKQMKSALMEFGNIIISHYCIGLSDFLKIQVYHDVPEMVFEEFGALIDGDIAQAAEKTDQVLFLQTQIQTQDKTMTGALIFIPDYDSITNFIKWINIDSIIELLDAESEGKSPKDLQKVQTEKSTDKSEQTKKKKSEAVKVEPKSTSTENKSESKKVESEKPDVKKVTEKKSDPVKVDSKGTDSKKIIANQVEEVFSKVQFQKDYKLADLDKKELKVTDGDLDTFRELGNIGAGNAGNALSQMLNKKVYLEIPPAKVLSLDNLIKEYADKAQNFVGYIGSTRGFFEANIFLLFNTEHVENVIQMIMETETKKSLKYETDLSTTEKSAITELLNILLGHYIAAMSDFLKSQIDPPEYRFFFKRGKQIFSQLDSSDENRAIKAIMVETSINVADSNPIKGLFIMLLHPKIVQRIIERINQIW